MVKKLSFLIFILLILASFVSAYDIEFYHSDNLGSPVVVTDSSGDVKWSADYESFGAAKNEVGEGDLKYNQKELDDTNLYYYGARYYDSSVGRFITADSYTGELTDSQSQNRYIYVKNNPLKYIDPTGNKIKPAEGKATWGVQTAKLMNSFFDDELFSYTKGSGINAIRKLIGGSSEQKELYNLFKYISEDTTEFEIKFMDFSKNRARVVPAGSGFTTNTIVITPVSSGRYGINGEKISFDYSTVLAHELAHAKGLIPKSGVAFRSEANSVHYENLARKIQGYKLRKYYWVNFIALKSNNLILEAGTPEDYDAYISEGGLSGYSTDQKLLSKHASETISIPLKK